MALAMRGFILVAPKPRTVQIPICNYYQRKNSMIMLQTQHDLKHGRNISRSIITCAKKQRISSGSGGQINQTTSADQLNVSDASSSNSQTNGEKSKGDANTDSKKTGTTD
ncbi:hypothetical protein M0R45_015218 [Rubus argutus]|uniref:Uncharacterized protein n=1 Tax=Rubus argutus TaxID=59490 RepID=A0AAW1XQP0_RUBAR